MPRTYPSRSRTVRPSKTAGPAAATSGIPSAGSAALWNSIRNRVAAGQASISDSRVPSRAQNTTWNGAGAARGDSVTVLCVPERPLMQSFVSNVTVFYVPAPLKTLDFIG